MHYTPCALLSGEDPAENVSDMVPELRDDTF